MIFELNKMKYKDETVFFRKKLDAKNRPTPKEVFYEFSVDEHGNKFISSRVGDNPAFWLDEFEQMAYSNDEFDRIGYDEVNKLLGDNE